MNFVNKPILIVGGYSQWLFLFFQNQNTCDYVFIPRLILSVIGLIRQCFDESQGLARN